MNLSVSHKGTVGLYIFAVVLAASIPLFVWVFEGFSPIVLFGLTGSLVAVSLMIGKSEWLPMIAMASTVLAFDNKDGLQIPELIYYLLSAILIGFAIFPKVIAGQMKPTNGLDKSFYFLVFVTFVGLVVGFLNRPGAFAFAEYTYFFPIYGFFLYRFSENNSSQIKQLLAVYVLLCVFIIIRNFLNYQQLLIDAAMEWEVEKARVAKEETMVMAACILSVIYYLFGPNWKHKVIALGATGISVAGLILTQSRGFWVATMFGLGILFLLLDKKRKIESLLVLVVVSTLAFLVAQLFFSDKFDLISRGLIERFTSLGTGRTDVSLYERYLEGLQIIEITSKNPIVGWGLAHPYMRYDINVDIYREYSYVHNGYLGVWYKFGLMGITAIASLFIFLFTYSSRILKRTNDNFVVGMTLFGVSICMSLLLVNNTSAVFYSFPGYATIAFVAAFVSIEYNKLQKT